MEITKVRAMTAGNSQMTQGGFKVGLNKAECGEVDAQAMSLGIVLFNQKCACVHRLCVSVCLCPRR